MGGVVCRKVSRHRVCVGTAVCGTVFCWALITLLDQWAPHNILNIPKQVNDPIAMMTANMDRRWEAEYESRVQRVRDVCDKDEIVAMRRVWRVATNRRFGKETYCKNKMCPIIVDEKKVLFYCFIPKIASTSVKRFFLNISGIHINETFSGNDTFLHEVANNALRRISPMYYPSTTVNRFFKIIFVRHPFDRLVSAFRSKAERPRHEVPFFYDNYWDPVLKKLRPGTTDQITFREFVWYLIHTAERDYDDHWTPYWSRCDPCLVDYDFIGKLETAHHDFPYAFQKVGIQAGPEWWTDIHPHHHSHTLRYFSNVPKEDIQKLYGIYKFDFELFGYSVEEFLTQNRTL